MQMSHCDPRFLHLTKLDRIYEVSGPSFRVDRVHLVFLKVLGVWGRVVRVEVCGVCVSVFLPSPIAGCLYVIALM